MRPTLIFLILNLIVVSCLELNEDKWDRHLTQECNCIDYLESFENSTNYKNKLIACSKLINNNTKWGFVLGSNCDVKIPFIFDEANFFACGLAPVKIKGKWGAVNYNGKFKIKPKYKELDFFNDSLAAFCDENDKWGVINTKGKIIVNPKYQYINSFYANIAFAQLPNGKWIILNDIGNVLPIAVDHLVEGYYEEFDNHTLIVCPAGLNHQKEFFDYPIYSNGKKVHLYVFKNEFALLDEKIDTRLITVGKKKIPKELLKSIY